MASQSRVNRLLTVSLFAASSLGTLALFGAVPMLPQLTARLAGILPDLSELASESPQPQVNRQLQGSWVAQLPENMPENTPENGLGSPAGNPRGNSLNNEPLPDTLLPGTLLPGTYLPGTLLPDPLRRRSAELQRYRLPR